MNHPSTAALPMPPRSDAKLTIGWMAQTVQNGGVLSDDDRAIYEHYRDTAPVALLMASQAYHEWFPEHAADFGFTHVETTRWTPDRGYVSTTRRLRPSGASRLIPRTRVREHRPGRARRASSSSSTSAADPPGDPEPSWPSCPVCGQPLHTDHAGAEHCGGCAVTWWEGTR